MPSPPLDPDVRARARRRSALLLSALLALYGGSLLYLILAGERGESGRLWAGYYTLAVPERVPEDEVLRYLESAGFSDVVTERTTKVLVTAFSHVEEIPLTAMSERLEAEDPRYDPYIQRLPGFFEAQSPDQRYRLYYLPSTEGAVSTVFRLRRGLPADAEGWFVADFAGLHRWLGFGAMVVLALVLTALLSGRRLAMAASTLPWILGSLSVGGAWTALGGAVSVGAFLIAQDQRQDRSLAGIAGGGAILLALAWIARDGSLPALPTISALLGSISAIALSFVIRYRRRVGKDHRLFSPVSIVPRGVSNDARALHRALPVLPALLALGVLLALLPGSRRIEVPSPTAAVGEGQLSKAGPEGGTHELLSELWARTRQDDLPNLSDYLAHVAYQEGFSYGAEFTFPEEEYPLTVLEIREESGRLVEANRIAAVYDEEWIARNLESVPPGSVEALLVRQPNFTGVVKTPLRGLYSTTSHLITYIAVLLIANLPIVIGVLILRLRGARARGSRSLLGRLDHGLAPYLPEGGNSSI